MSEHAAHTDSSAHSGPRIMERHCDVAIVGGSAAGLAAALQIARQARSVIVIDAGEPRNAPAAHMHSYLGHEGLPPGELTAIGREEVRSYGVEVLAGRAVDVTRHDDGSFQVELTGGHRVVARRIVAATGLVDHLPDIPGLAEHWGGDVIHCPFCHGYEVRDRRVVQIVTHPMGLHPASLFRQLTDQLTIILHSGVGSDDPEVVSLRDAGVTIFDGLVARVVTGDDGHVVAVELTDGETIDADAIVIGARFSVRADPFTSLGLRPTEHPSGVGDYIETDATGATSVPGLFAAGNVTDPSLQVIGAAAAGSRVGAMVSFSLAHEDIEAAARPSSQQSDWDNRYSGNQIWSGNPNGTLVNQVAELTPGRALDVGAGEGGDAIWLAEQGWTVTASDISQSGLARVAAAAHARDLVLECLHTDANAIGAFPVAAYDLVTAHYASVPRTPDARAVTNLIDAVASGGTLLVVGHDLEPMRSPIDTHEHSRAFDGDAFIRSDDFAAVLDQRSDWDIELREKRPRPPGAVSGHHVDDIVLRAHRR